jgi:hypothetical protein
MHGGYNIETLIGCSRTTTSAPSPPRSSSTLLVFEAFHDVAEGERGQRQRPRRHAELGRRRVVHAPPGSARAIKAAVFKVTGETNTDDLSPAPDAWSRPDIPLHALAMYKMTRRPDPRAHGRARWRRSTSSRPRACRWPSSATWSAPAPRASPPPTRCCGSSATTSRGAEQERRRHLHRRQGRADLLQHDGRLRRPGLRGPVDELNMGDVIDIKPL